MPLAAVAVTPFAGPLPEPVRALLAAAASAHERHHATARTLGTGFVASDYEGAFRLLRALFHQEPDRRTFCEWGSGLGIVAGLAAGVGYRAAGLEVDRRLVAASRELLAAHDLTVDIAHGSFLPADEAPPADAPLDARTVWSAASGYDELGRDLADFDVVYAYPWPGEERAYAKVFLDHADFGALFVTFHGEDGFRVRRKVARRGP